MEEGRYTQLMPDTSSNISILIIAAGQSKRLGKPKQLLTYEGKTLINRLIEIVRSAGELPITLVLGAFAEEIIHQLPDTDLQLVLNPHWEEGMGRSISAGVSHIMQYNPEVDGIIIMVCDQPYITADEISGLIREQRKTGKSIVACAYNGILGTPALFLKEIWKDLLALKGDMGAKKLIGNHEADVSVLYFEKGVLDIDTPQDYKNLIGEK